MKSMKPPRAQPDPNPARQGGRGLTGDGESGPARGLLRRLWRPAAVVALLGLHYGLAITALSDKCTTFDELLHQSAGYAYWKYDDYRMNPANGNLVGRLAALPLLSDHYTFPERYGEGWQGGKEWLLSTQFYYLCGNDVAQMLLRGRMAMGVLSVGLGLLVYFWARRIFSPNVGLFCLALYALEPTVLAHGCLMTSDMAAAFFFTLSLLGFWRLLEKFTLRRLALSCLATGLLFVAKFSCLLVVPMMVLLVAVRVLRSPELVMTLGKAVRSVHTKKAQAAVWAGVLVLHGLAAYLTIWGAFGFRYSAFSDLDPKHTFAGPWQGGLKTGLTIQADLFARDHHLLPEAYLYGFTEVYNEVQGRSSFLHGDYALLGWRTFFPYAFAIKTPIPTLVLLALALACPVGLVACPALTKRSDWPIWRERLYQSLPLVVLVGVYWASAINTAVNIGIRHVLPTYGAIFILAGWASYWLAIKPRIFRAILPACVLLLAVETFRAWPDYIPYFNPFVGGSSNGWRYLVDSSSDWGQDLPGLRKWLDAHHANNSSTYLSYFGMGYAPYYGIAARRITSEPLVETEILADFKPGLYCFSASMLDGVFGTADGAWNYVYERDYQDLCKSMGRRVGRYDPNQVNVPEGFHVAAKYFDGLRFARLAMHMRQRQPDDQVGNSILIYRVSAEDLRQALEDPPLECRENPASMSR